LVIDEVSQRSTAVRKDHQENLTILSVFFVLFAILKNTFFLTTFPLAEPAFFGTFARMDFALL
jgi:hypothetical protein